MTTPSIPVKKDTAPRAFRELAESRLYGSREFIAYLDAQLCKTCPKDDCCCAAPDEWLEAAAMEAYVAFTETLDTWVTTLIAGRPWDMPLVEWEARDLSPQAEHHDCIPVDDVREAAAER